MINPESQEQKQRKPTQAFPKNSILESLKIAEAIKEYNAGKPFSRLTLAKSLNYSPSSSKFRMLIISSGKFGLTSGGYMADQIELTALGTSIVMPKNETERNDSLSKALLSIPFFDKFYNSFNNHKIPPEELLKNTLNRDYAIPVEDTEKCYKLIIKNAEELDLIEEIKGSNYIKLENSLPHSAVLKEPQQELNLDENIGNNNEPNGSDGDQEEIPEELSKQYIFIAHGKDGTPVNQLTKILDKFKIPYKVAVEEPNRALPVSDKIASLMKECSAGIFIFTGDEKYVDSNGKTIFKPSENVIYELGAASVLYGNRIVIFKEEGLDFPSDFSGIGYTSFENNNLTSKTPELLAELIEFNLIKISI